MYSIKQDLTKSNILSKVSEIDIFRYYCDNFNKPGEKFSSEFRKDKNPSCKIDNYKGRIYYKDFAEQGVLSCFDYVMKKFHCDYFTALCIINRDFKLDLDGKDVFHRKSEKTPIIRNETYSKIYSGKSHMRVRYTHWSEQSIEYIESYKLDCVVVSEKFRVNPIDYYWINGRQFKAAELTFAYFFGIKDDRYIYKIYQPLETQFKWFHNLDQSIIQGWSQLPESGPGLVITKGYKDVLCFDSFNIPAIAPGAEGWDIPDKILDNLFERFSTIISIYDFDLTGIKGMNKLKRRYGIKPIPILQGNHSRLIKSNYYYTDKDFSDFCKNNSLETINQEINNIKYKLKF